MDGRVFELQLALWSFKDVHGLSLCMALAPHFLHQSSHKPPSLSIHLQVRVPPPPIPMSWGRAVAPYQPPAPPSTSGAAAGNAGGTTAGPCAAAAAGGERAAAQVGTGSGEATTSGRPAHGSCYCEASDLNDFDFTQLPQRHHLAVLINTGWLWQPGEGSSWQERKAGGAGAALLQRLQQLPVPALCPRGFVFIWAPKEHLAGVSAQGKAGWEEGNGQCLWGTQAMRSMCAVVMVQQMP